MSRKGQKGFTLIEITIILLVLVILGAILLPMAERFIDLARLARVREDIGALAAIVELFKFDNCQPWFKQNGASNAYVSGNRVDLLVGDGDIAANTLPVGVINHGWDEAIDLAPPGDVGVVVDTIANQLAAGVPFGVALNAYPRPTGTNPFACGFRGAYIQTPINADPWGNRYMINVAFLGPEGTRALGAAPGTFHNMDVFVMSAGPDETIGTPFTVDGVVAGGDDQIAVVSGGF